MLALYRSDRQADALAVYRDGRRHLVEELGIEPGVPLRELERAILDQDPSLGAGAPPSRAEALGMSGLDLRRSRGLLVAVGVLVVVGAIAAVAAVVSGGDSTITVRPNEVGVVDPSTNTVTDALRVGSSPRGVAVGEGAVWVANLDDKTISRIDPRTHAVRTFATTATPTGIAAGLGAVWVAHWRGTVERIAPRYERPSDTIRALGPSAVLRPITPFSARATVTVGSGAVWAAYFNSTVVRIDPRDDKPHASGYAGAQPSGIAVSNEAVWVANFGANTVSRLDPNNLKPETSAPITVGKGPSAIAVGGGAVWVADRFSDFVSRIDPFTNTTTTIRVGRRPDALAYGFGSVWVANGGSGTVTRIDPRTSSVIRTIKVGNSPSGIAVGEHRVWVTVQRA
jgi:YVTN family beta-propeller protein